MEELDVCKCIILRMVNVCTLSVVHGLKLEPYSWITFYIQSHRL